MSQQHTYSRLHQLSGPFLYLDLEEKGRGILEEARLAPAGRAAETLVKEGPLRLTILGFTAGASMANHRAKGPVSIEVIEGQIAVRAAEQTRDIVRGEALVVDADVPHSVVAKSDSVVLLYIAIEDDHESAAPTP